jgi:hypothetical protein
MYQDELIPPGNIPENSISELVKKLFKDFISLSEDEKNDFFKLVNSYQIENKKLINRKQKNSIKIWPYLDDISQAIVQYSDEHLSDRINNMVNLDFSQTCKYSSSAATIVILKLMTLLAKKKYSYRVILPEEPDIEECFQESGFFSILDEYLHFKNIIDLFDNVNFSTSIKPHVSFNKKKTIKKIHFPIFKLEYEKNNKRKRVKIFINKLIDIFEEHLSKYNIRLNALISIINEIAKNSHDHTEADSYFGLDIFEEEKTNSGKLFFSFADLGEGIYTHVKNCLIKSGNIKEAEKYGFSDAYHAAFTHGFTTSKNPINKGIGMNIIQDRVISLDLDLTIWDGKSMLIVPKELTHSKIRRVIFDTGNPVGFYYCGILNF